MVAVAASEGRRPGRQVEFANTPSANLLLRVFEIEIAAPSRRAPEPVLLTAKWSSFGRRQWNRVIEHPGAEAVAQPEAASLLTLELNLRRASFVSPVDGAPHVIIGGDRSPAYQHLHIQLDTIFNDRLFLLPATTHAP